MGLVSKDFTFSTGATILASEHNSNYDTLFNLVNGNVDNANIKANAGIVDSKLAQITTASKVSGSALTSLTSVPAGAGVIPAANTGLPIGSLTMWTTDTAPAGWELCDGTAYDASVSTEYQPLFDVIANTFGGSDNTDFQVPDMRGRFPLGQDDMGGSSANRVTSAQADSVGGAGGSETIAEAQLPAHTHTIATQTTTNSGGAGDIFHSNAVTTGNKTSGSTGSGDAYNQPFITLNFIIRYS